MNGPVDVLSVMREHRALRVGTQGAVMSDYDGSLARIDAAIAVVAELIETAREMNRLAKGPVEGVSMDDKRAIIAKMDAVLARVGGAP